MINIQDSELLQLNHERQTPTELNHFDQHYIFDLYSTSCILLSVSLSVIAIGIWAG